ncbi:MAG: ankyrin repeat domain-containing protein, partial [Chloroflexi bacterium]|nr:ankyrin repeat domain-containing protein [Chloroflexota bacterium]
MTGLIIPFLPPLLASGTGFLDSALPVLEWLVWGFSAVVALSWTWGCRGYASRGGINALTVAQTMLLLPIPIAFLFVGWSKFHILWVMPAAIVSVYVLVLIPGVNIILAFLTNLFAWVILRARRRDLSQGPTDAYESIVVPTHGSDDPQQEELDCELADAVALGDVRTAAHWIGLGANPNARCLDHEGALCRAILNDDLAMVALLVENGADVNRQGSTGSGPLHRAAHMGNVTIADLLISNGAVVDRVNLNGETPLCDAVSGRHWHLAQSLSGGHWQVAQSLIRAGSDVNFRDQYSGATPLHLEAELG